VGLAELEDGLDLAVERTLSDEAVVRARDYVHVGRLYGLRNEDTGEGAEAVAYRAVMDALRVHLEATR
jgi:hypothetical protein